MSAWIAHNPPLAIPAWGTGAADTLEDAKLAFRAAWERFYDTLTPANIAHWHATDDATEAQGYNRAPDAK
jgi:hypothetical protein